MDKIVSENLFLLEFLVDKCLLLPSAISKELQCLSGETCVCFKFLDNGPFDVCEEDFTPKQNYSSSCEDGNTRTGKSCLFAMSESQAEEALKEFDIEVCVFKKLTGGMLPEKLQIGMAAIPIVTLFNEVITLLQAKDQTETVSRTLKDNFNITNTNAETIGTISVFIRMSCFGKLIVTQFQMNLEDKSVFFKDKEGKSLYKYRKASKNDKMKSTCKPISQPASRGVDAMDQFDGRCVECSTEMTQYAGDLPVPQPQVVQPYRSLLSEKGNYQEIGAEMNGNALTIRVHKNKGNIKRLDDSDATGFVGGISSRNDACFCTGDSTTPRLVQQPNGCYCLKSGNQYQTPCSQKQVLSLKPGNDPNNPFAFRVSGCPNSVNNNVTVVSPTSTRADGMQVTEISDPNKDIFILRIGKKTEGTDKKANLELELVTPKGIDRKPIPKKETRETQYMASDADPDYSVKRKGKKKKKGKKGKKVHKRKK